jgi:cell division septation protein DedD
VLLAQIQSLGGVYTNAYIRKIGSYYKVQMGAFGVKTNAVNMLNELKAKGFDAFITTI